MSRPSAIGLIILMLFLPVSCSVISRQVRAEAEPTVPFRTLVQDADRKIGKTVILGGYILKTENLADETIIEVLQAPLGLWDEPGSKDHSEGRFTVSHKGFLDPEVYRKDRRITVAGILAGCAVEKVGICKIESREIYTWPEYEYGYDPYYYYPRGYYYWHGYPHRRHFHHGHHHYW